MSTTRLGPLAALFVIALTIAGCSKPPETPDLVLIHTGRLRGNIYPGNMSGTAPLQYYPFIAGYVKAVREEAKATGAEVVVVDLGDSLTGSFASLVTKGRNVQAFFNTLGYDAVMLGNLDGEIKPELVQGLKMPVLCPFEDAGGKPAMPGSVLSAKIKKGAHTLEILPNFYGDIDPKEHPERFPVVFGGTSPIVPLRDYSSVTAALGPKPEGGLRMLGWLKFEPPPTPPVAFLSMLQTAGVDVIAAHRIYGAGQKDVWSQETPDWSIPVSLNLLRDNRGFAVARLDLKRDGKGWRVMKRQLVAMTANEAKADPAVMAAIQPFAEEIQSADEVLTELDKDLSEEEILKRMLTAFASESGTDAALYSSSSIRTGWPRGKLRASRVYDALPWPNRIVKVTLSQEQFQKLLAEKKFAILRKSGAPPETGPVQVVTSEFFARLLSGQLKLPSDAILPISEAIEFQYFIERLKAGAATGEITEPWSYEAGANS